MPKMRHVLALLSARSFSWKYQSRSKKLYITKSYLCCIIILGNMWAEMVSQSFARDQGNRKCFGNSFNDWIVVFKQPAFWSWFSSVALQMRQIRQPITWSCDLGCCQLHSVGWLVAIEASTFWKEMLEGAPNHTSFCLVPILLGLIVFDILDRIFFINLTGPGHPFNISQCHCLSHEAVTLTNCDLWSAGKTDRKPCVAGDFSH